MGGAGIEGEAGSVMAEGVEGASGMVPGGDKDDFLGVAGAEEGEGELGVLTGGLGLVFELDGGLGDAAGEEDAFVIEGIAGAGDEDARGGAVVEELGGAFDAFGGVAAEQDDDVGAGGGVIDAEELPGEGPEGGEQGGESHKGGEGEPVSGFELHGPPFLLSSRGRATSKMCSNPTVQFLNPPPPAMPAECAGPASTDKPHASVGR